VQPKLKEIKIEPMENVAENEEKEKRLEEIKIE